MKRYCGNCERMVNMELLEGQEYHEILIIHDDFVFCFGPFYYSPAPELPDNWDKGLETPTEDELLLMDMNAEVLESDFGVV